MRKCSFDAGLSRVTKKGLVSAWSCSPVAAAVDSIAAFTLKRSLVLMVLFPDAAKYSVRELCPKNESSMNSLFGSMKGLLSVESPSIGSENGFVNCPGDERLSTVSMNGSVG